MLLYGMKTSLNGIFGGARATPLYQHFISSSSKP